MTDEELERLANAAAEAVGPVWKLLPTIDGRDGWVESATDGKSIGTGYDGEWDVNAARFSAAADPATVLAMLERVRKAEAQLATIAAHIEYAGKESGLPDAVQAFVLASVKTTRAALERAERAEAKVAKMLCPNFEHDWAPCQPDGAGFVTECRRCPATIHTVDFRPALKP